MKVGIAIRRFFEQELRYFSMSIRYVCAYEKKAKEGKKEGVDVDYK